MINVKSGTQTWSTAQQIVDQGESQLRNISSDQQLRHFGEADLGEVLNQVADPNYVDPSKVARQVGSNQLDKDAFMKLLLTQMKNQDPTNPMQSHEMAAQLAQFTSLEKLTNINDSIANLQKAQVPMQNFEALNLIGKAVSGDSSKIDRMDEGGVHPISFELPQDAVRGELTIKNADGEVVRKLSINKLKAGKNELVWNGQSEDGRALPRGTYKATIEAVGSQGSKLAVNTKFDGLISAVSFSAQGPILTIGKKQVPLHEIKEIRDPQTFGRTTTEVTPNRTPVIGNSSSAAVPNREASAPTQSQPQSKPQAQALTPAQVEEPDIPVGAKRINDVAMSQGLINQLNREGVKAGM